MVTYNIVHLESRQIAQGSPNQMKFIEWLGQLIPIAVVLSEIDLSMNLQ
jgi:hypothetical protein